jgi:hypothetical protein
MPLSDAQKALLQRRLAQVERDVAGSERAVARQRNIIVMLERDGTNATTARELLVCFQETLEAHVTDRDQLRRELGLKPSGI